MNTHCDDIEFQIDLAVAGWLDEVAAGRLREHLEHCPACQARHEAGSLLAVMIGGQPAPPRPEIRVQDRPATRAPWLLGGLTAGLAACLLALSYLTARRELPLDADQQSVTSSSAPAVHPQAAEPPTWGAYYQRLARSESEFHTMLEAQTRYSGLRSDAVPTLFFNPIQLGSL